MKWSSKIKTLRKNVFKWTQNAARRLQRKLARLITYEFSKIVWNTLAYLTIALTFLKMAKSSPFLFIFVLFTWQIKHNFEFNWEKGRDGMLGTQTWGLKDCRRRQIHSAMAAPRNRLQWLILIEKVLWNWQQRDVR